MAGSSSDAPIPPMIAQKTMTAVRLCASVIARAPIGVAEQAQHVGALAADEIADLAADQDERGRYQRLERDRRLDAADGRAEVVDHRRDRHVHQRRVDDEHEHRHRQQDGQPLIAGCQRGSAGIRFLAHRGSSCRSDARVARQGLTRNSICRGSSASARVG